MAFKNQASYSESMIEKGIPKQHIRLGKDTIHGDGAELAKRKRSWREAYTKRNRESWIYRGWRALCEYAIMLIGIVLVLFFLTCTVVYIWQLFTPT